MDWTAFALALGTVAFNGAVTLAVLRAELRHLAQGVTEAKADAALAHRRLDALILADRAD